MAIKVWVDAAACVAHGNCGHVAPEVFRLENGRSWVLEEGQIVADASRESPVRVPDGLEEHVTLARDTCPGGAIIIEEE